MSREIGKGQFFNRMLQTKTSLAVFLIFVSFLFYFPFSGVVVTKDNPLGQVTLSEDEISG